MKQENEFRMFPVKADAPPLSRWEWFAGFALAAVAARHDVPHNNYGAVVTAAARLADVMEAEAKLRERKP